ncbi:hypothetical protein BDZ91DRAFT_792293 [Kalaharituber pfeilii]|nr:hypothetical protein BDZ91DRAFT_792293 [Kalaharituber pfeilii]
MANSCKRVIALTWLRKAIKAHHTDLEDEASKEGFQLDKKKLSTDYQDQGKWVSRKVRKWLESDNKELGETTGIRWLRKKTTLIDEGKKTSSVVLYLKTQREVGKVRLGGRWLRSETYEQDRGKK